MDNEYIQNLPLDQKISFSQVNFCSRAQFIILYLGTVK